MREMLQWGWTETRRPTVRRWLYWLVHATMLTVFTALLIPAFRLFPEGVHAYFVEAPSWQRVLVLLVGCTLVVGIVFRLLAPKVSHVRGTILRRYPPLWTAWVVAAVVVCSIDLAFGLGPPGYQASFWEWIFYGCGSVLFVVIYRHFTSAPVPLDVASVLSDSTSVGELVNNWEKLERWLRSDRPAEDDLIGNRRIARRLAGYLTNNGGTIGIVGPFGSGKTSVVSWLKTEVRQRRKPGQAEIWFAEQSCWGFEDSGAAVQQVLARATEAIAREVDCFSLRSLPESYRKTFSAAGDWLRTLADLVFGSADALEQFRQLSEILESVDARLVLVIEDLDLK
jgi:KAP family P-loop domain